MNEILLTHRTLLYIGNEQDIGDSAKSLLEKSFRNVIYSKNEDKILEKYFSDENSSNDIDILLIDISNIDFSFIKKIRSNNEYIPILLLSDNFSNVSAIDIIEQNIYYCSYLPLESNKILKKLYNALKLEDRQKLNTYFNEIAIIVKTDINGTVLSVNKKFTEVSGYSKDEILGKNQNEIKHKDTLCNKYKEMWDHIINGKSWNGILKNKKKDGGEYYVDTSIFPIFDSKKKTKEFLGIKFLVTQEKEEIAKLKKYIIEQKSEHIKNCKYVDCLVQNEIKEAIQSEVEYNEQLKKIIFEQDLEIKMLRQEKVNLLKKTNLIDAKLQNLQKKEHNDFITSKVKIKQLIDLNLKYQNKIIEIEKENLNLNKQFEDLNLK